MFLRESSKGGIVTYRGKEDIVVEIDSGIRIVRR